MTIVMSFTFSSKHIEIEWGVAEPLSIRDIRTCSE